MLAVDRTTPGQDLHVRRLVARAYARRHFLDQRGHAVGEISRKPLLQAEHLGKQLIASVLREEVDHDCVAAPHQARPHDLGFLDARDVREAADDGLQDVQSGPQAAGMHVDAVGGAPLGVHAVVKGPGQRPPVHFEFAFRKLVQRGEVLGLGKVLSVNAGTGMDRRDSAKKVLQVLPGDPFGIGPAGVNVVQVQRVGGDRHAVVMADFARAAI